MEQKMLLPITVVVVLVAGFMIGYYASAAGFSKSVLGKSTDKTSPLSSIESNNLFVEPSSTSVTRAQFTEEFTGTIKRIRAESWVLATKDKKELTLPATTLFVKSVTASELGAKINSSTAYELPMPPQDVKVGDAFKVTVQYNAKSGKLTAIKAAKR